MSEVFFSCKRMTGIEHPLNTGKRNLPFTRSTGRAQTVFQNYVWQELSAFRRYSGSVDTGSASETWAGRGTFVLCRIQPFHSNKWDIVVGYFIKCQASLPAGLFYGIVYKDSSVIKWKRKISVSLTLICVSSLFVKYTVSDFINYEARGFNQPAWLRFLWRNSWRSMAKAREGLPDG